MKPLHGFTVLDLSTEQAGPFSTMILSDLGAEVIKIENPKTGGDPSRYEGVLVNGHSLAYTSINRGKKSVLLDLEDMSQRELFLELVKKAHILVESERPGYMEKIGLSYEELKKINPKLVYTSITAFGQYGPYKDRAADDMTIQGLCGIMSMVGDINKPSVRIGIDMAAKVGGLYGCIGSLIALYGQMLTGEGQAVDVAQLDALMATMEAPYVRYDMTGDIPKAQGNRHPTSTPFGDFRCADGESVVVNISTDDQYKKWAEALERPDLCESPLADGTYRQNHHAESDAVAEEVMKKFPSEEVVRRLEAVGVPYSQINTVKAITDSEHIAAHHMIAPVRYSDGTLIQVVSTPMRYNDSAQQEEYVASDLGADTFQVLEEFLPDARLHECLDASVKEASEVGARLRSSIQ